MADKIQFRRDTKERWKAINPTLAEGEIGLETDTQHQKIGNGVDAWNDLEYTIGVGNITQSTGDSENLVISQRAVTELVKGIKEGMNASEYIAIRIPDLSEGVTTSGAERQKEILKKFVDWLNAVNFLGDSLYMGHCILGLDGRIADVYNHPFSYADNYGVQIVMGGFIADVAGGIQIDQSYHILLRTHANGLWSKWTDYCEQNITNTEGTSTKLAVSQNLLNSIKVNLKNSVDTNTTNIASQGTRISTLESSVEHIDKVVDNIQEVDKTLRDDVDTNTTNIASNKTEITELQESVFPLILNFLMDKTPIEYTGNTQSVKYSYYIKRKNEDVIPTSLILAKNGTSTKLTPHSSGFGLAYVTENGNYTFVLSATYGNLKADKSITINVVLPIYSGFSTEEINVDIITLDNKKVATSPNGNYTLNNATDGCYLWICVPAIMSINKITLNGFDVPMEDVISGSTALGNYNCYRSSNKLVKGSYTFKVE